MSMPPQKPGKSKQDVETPNDLMEAIRRRFGDIGWDLAASKENTKAFNYFTEEHNSLIQNWGNLDKLLWLNPPYADIEPWVKKCSETELKTHGKILVLVPASVGSEWYRKYVEPFAYVLALNPRVTFVGHKTAYPKDLILAVYGNELTGFKTWRWK